MTESVRKTLPLPVVMSGWKGLVSYDDLAFRLASVRKSYENQDFASLGMRVDFTTDDGRKRLKIRERELINRQIENEAIRRISGREGISFTLDDARNVVNGQLGIEDDESRSSVIAHLSSLYGWTLDYFTQEVVLPSLYEKELQRRFEGDESRFAEARGKAEEARRRLDDGRTFAETSAEFSEGRTAADGGSMGWFLYDDLDLSLRDAARNQAPGVAGPVIESDLGFHILLVKDRKAEGDEELVDLNQIFVAKQSFGDWLSEEMRGMSVRALAPEYQWNGDTARMEFRDPDLRRFEENILMNSEGDASVIF